SRWSGTGAAGGRCGSGTAFTSGRSHVRGGSGVPSQSVRKDPLTFGQLRERRERELFAYALRISGQRADAEDLYQDTFLAAFRAWPPPRRGNERAWLYEIATNRAIDRERRAKRIVANGEDLAIAAPERDDVTLADLAGAIETLPAGQRAAFVLRKVQGLPYVEIAIALECTEQAARARVSEALKKVKAAVALR